MKTIFLRSEATHKQEKLITSHQQKLNDIENLQLYADANGRDIWYKGEEYSQLEKLEYNLLNELEL